MLRDVATRAILQLAFCPTFLEEATARTFAAILLAVRNELSPLFPRVLVTARRSKVSSLLPLPAVPLLLLWHLTRATRVLPLMRHTIRLAAHATRHASEHKALTARIAQDYFPRAGEPRQRPLSPHPSQFALLEIRLVCLVEMDYFFFWRTFQTVSANASSELRGHLRRGAAGMRTGPHTGVQRVARGGTLAMGQLGSGAGHAPLRPDFSSEACEALAVPAPQVVLGQF